MLSVKASLLFDLSDAFIQLTITAYANGIKNMIVQLFKKKLNLQIYSEELEENELHTDKFVFLLQIFISQFILVFTNKKGTHLLASNKLTFFKQQLNAICFRNIHR